MAIRLGTRVVRGPDWKWENQDKQAGNLGTVIEIRSDGLPGWVTVRWDHGRGANYRCGVEGKYDIFTYDNASAGVNHQHITCDNCRENEIGGVRWKCSQCFDYDLCNRCFHKGAHDKSHRFYRIEHEDGPWVLTGPRLLTAQLTGLVPGATVARGADWKWGTQDGALGPLEAILGVGGKGEVLEVKNWNDSGKHVKLDAVRVSWKTGGSNTYRVGFEGKVDVKVVDDVSPGDRRSMHYYRSHLASLGRQYTAHSSGSFSAGSRVKVSSSSTDELRRAQSSTSGCSWDSKMQSLVGMVGRIRSFPSGGCATIEFLGEGRGWTLSMSALEEVSTMRAGDHVRVTSNKLLCIAMQRGHGGWNEKMAGVLGAAGQVVRLDGDGDVRVRFSGGQTWTFSPLCLSLISRGSAEGLQDDSEDGSEQLLRLLGTLLGSSISSTTSSISGGGSSEDSFTRLYNAAVRGDSQVAREVLRTNPGVKNGTHKGVTPLHMAMYKGHTGVINALTDAGADLEVKDNDGDTALMQAMHGDQSASAGLLLGRGANGNARNNNGMTALHLACAKELCQCMRVLLQHKVSSNLKDNSGIPPLLISVAKDHGEGIDILLEHHVDVFQSEDRGSTGLHLAASKGLMTIARKLLRADRKLANAKQNDGWTPLHIAAREKQLEVAKLLIEQYNCDVNMASNKAATALHLAVDVGCNAMIELLVGSGARVNASDADGDTPLHISLFRSGTSSQGGQEAILRAALLAVAGISESHVDKSGWVAIACYLALHGADLNFRNEDGKTPLFYLRDEASATHIRQCARMYQQSHTSRAPSDGIRVRGSSDGNDGIRVSTGDGIRVTTGDGIRVSSGSAQQQQQQAKAADTQWNIPPVSKSGQPSTREPPSPQKAPPGAQQKPTPAKRTTQPRPSTNYNAPSTGANSQKTKGVVDGTSQGAASTTTTNTDAGESSANQILCNLCESVANACCLPCTHINLCDTCSKRAKKCLTCHRHIDEARSLTMCMLCDSELAAVLFQPCNHSSLCLVCAQRASKCPECRTPVSEKWYNGSKI